MKNILLSSILLIFYFNTFSQDIIIRTNNDKINCKITSTDSSHVFFTYKKDDHFINTSLEKTQIQEIKHDEPGSLVVTVGLLEGGGSLVGFDLEFFLSKNIGFQIGGGIVGYGGGLNFHFKPSPRSSFISIQYWHQGLPDSYTQSLLGPSFVFRGKKWFTAQLGVGFALEKGEAFPQNIDQSEVMLTYAIGIYVPW